MTNSVIVWKEPTGAIVPKGATQAHEIANVAKNLSLRDQKQIINAFQSDSFE
jgi:hypothetical protein